MGIDFEVTSKETRFLDPRNGFEPAAVSTEIRKDPLTGESGRILGFPARPVPRLDLQPIVETSLEMGCPFCPDVIDQSTPRFPPDVVPEGRLHVGETTVLPNLFPYDTYSGLAIVTRAHFVPMTGFSTSHLVDALSAGQLFFRRMRDVDPAAVHCSINWNYMPLSGGTMIHPHMQLIGGSVPSNQERLLLECSARYAHTHGSSFWLDLIEEERKREERFIREESGIAWLAPFVPKGYLDVMAVFQDRPNLWDVTQEDFRAFADGLQRVMQYFDHLNYYSLNLSLYSAPPDVGTFRTHVRIIPRVPVGPVLASDRNYFHVLHNEALNLVRPEALAANLREYWSESWS